MSEDHRKANVTLFEKELAAGKFVPTIAIDFDGVIHAYTSPWTEARDVRDEPVPGAFAFIRHAIDNEFRVAVHTARANDTVSEQYIRDWFVLNGLERSYVGKLVITSHKIAALIYIDDRGYHFTGTFPTLDEIRARRQWNKPA